MTFYDVLIPLVSILCLVMFSLGFAVSGGRIRNRLPTEDEIRRRPKPPPAPPHPYRSWSERSATLIEETEARRARESSGRCKCSDIICEQECRCVRPEGHVENCLFYPVPFPIHYDERYGQWYTPNRERVDFVECDRVPKPVDLKGEAAPDVPADLLGWNGKGEESSGGLYVDGDQLRVNSADIAGLGLEVPGHSCPISVRRDPPSSDTAGVLA